MNSLEISKELLAFINESPSVYHVIENIKGILEGFTELRENEAWELVPGGKYYVTRNGSSIVAFTVPRETLKGFNVAAAHSDSPCFKVKPGEEICVESKYLKLNTEKYGGMLMAPWFDRPLSVAGRVVIKENTDNGTAISMKLVNIDKDFAMIPNLAIHMDRTLNDGYKYNAQKDMLPLVAMGNSTEDFTKIVAKYSGVQETDILDMDMFLYNRMKGIVWGENDEFISSRALDDLQCAWSLVKALSASESQVDRANVVAVFDNEEVGSLTKQGADSTFLKDVMKRISNSLGGDSDSFKLAVSNSFMVSADNAHAVHPNYPEKADPTNRPYINGGIVIKYNANQKYTTDGISSALFKSVLEKAGVPYQTYVNRSDIAGGSTLGNLSNAHVSLNTIDIGLPQLAMHSPYETAGVEDTAYLIKAMETYFVSSFETTESGYVIA